MQYQLHRDRLMKKAIIFIGVVLFVVSYFGYQGFFSKNSTGLKNAMIGTSERKFEEDVTLKINANEYEAQTKTEVDAVVKKTEDLAYLKLSADKKKKEIEKLMQQYDANKSDRDERVSIKKKIDNAMAEYNRMILPVAVEQVKKSQ